MTSTEFIKKLQDVVDSYKTLYVMGCFGAPLTGSNVSRYCTNHDYNKAAARTAMIKAAANQNPPVYGFDCVCLIKGLLWSWNGDAAKTYGGAGYKSNGVPDIDANDMIAICSGISTDFSNIVPGEVVWLDKHIGVYIGDGLAIECSPSWANKVQVTAVKNIGTKAGYNARTWTKHGKLPYITYEGETATQTTTTTRPIVSQGSTGSSVRELQTLLNGKGFSCGTVDGIFGPKTLTAVKAFQSKRSLTVDGIVGPLTWAALVA